MGEEKGGLAHVDENSVGADGGGHAGHAVSRPADEASDRKHQKPEWLDLEQQLPTGPDSALAITPPVKGSARAAWHVRAAARGGRKVGGGRRGCLSCRTGAFLAPKEG